MARDTPPSASFDAYEVRLHERRSEDARPKTLGLLCMNALIARWQGRVCHGPATFGATSETRESRVKGRTPWLNALAGRGCALPRGSA